MTTPNKLPCLGCMEKKLIKDGYVFLYAEVNCKAKVGVFMCTPCLMRVKNKDNADEILDNIKRNVVKVEGLREAYIEKAVESAETN